jgi:hypothetical protein
MAIAIWLTTMVFGVSRQHQLSRRRRIAAYVVCIVSLCVELTHADDAYLLGGSVTQKRGVVCTTDEFRIYRGQKGLSGHCWVLNSETAIGEVTKVIGNQVEVRFDSAEGWTKQVVAERKTYSFLRDYWGQPMLIVEVRETVSFDKDENGLLLSGEDEAGGLLLPIRVRFPSSCVSFPPPHFGDLVKRGPDWNKGSADGGQPDAVGRIILRSAEDKDVRSKDGYVTVEWELTKRKGRYRWDYRRKFDVIPVHRPKKQDAEEAPSSEVNTGANVNSADAVE